MWYNELKKVGDNMKPGTDNVIPGSKRTHEENVANGRKGGIKSGEVKREKKLFKEAIEKKLGDTLENIIDAMITKASCGDVQATTFLRDTIGEKPTDKVEMNANVSYEEAIKKVADKDEY